jgi:hypothetical protein
MLRYLATVSDVFELTGRGAVALIDPSGNSEWSLHFGDSVTLERPDGSTTVTTVNEIDIPRRQGPPCLALVMGAMSKADIPIGTKIWIDESRDPSHETS